MYLGNLIKTLNKNYKKIPIKGISLNSKKTKNKDVFFAIEGTKTSGTKFIAKAIEKGASAIITEKKIRNKNHKVPTILVKDARKILSEACSKFYKKKPKNILAVTGTNGKSSVADFFYQILSLNKKPTASIGTLGINSKSYKKKTNLTSLDPLFLHKNLQILANKKINFVILEASSHGLDQKRLNNLNIKIGIFTNLSHDHLDYHKNMKSYLNSKLYLFKTLLKKKSKIITDEDNKEFKIIKKIAGKRNIQTITIGKQSKDIKILNNKYKNNIQIVKVMINKKIYKLKIPLIGYFQVKNLLMAILAATHCGIKIDNVLNKIHKIKPVSGRLECVANLNNNSNIIVDFAHTPDALEQSLSAIKKQFKKKITIVFGCGGERDKKKRIMMGKIAKKYCNKIFVTDDNPRNEDPKKIRKKIIIGCKKLAINIPNRKKAIETAISRLNINEVLIVAGKGHEQTQDYGNKIIKFSDSAVIKNMIKKNIANKKNVNNNFFKNINYQGVSINSKSIKKNNLFFAIKGKNIDGHKFVKESLNKGAIKCVVSKKMNKLPNQKILKVKNTFTSLNDLADKTRDKTLAEIIGITGSVGKTTLKNLVGFALKNYGKVYCSPFSYNNKFGVPLSLANLKHNTEYGVFEIGMDKKGEIANLSKIVKPEIAVITNISAAHLKNFNSLKDIAKAKAEIMDNIVENGNIVLNKDDNFFNFLYKKAKKKGINVTTFSSKRMADIFLSSSKKIKNKYRLRIVVKENIIYLYVKNFTENFISNILACVSVLSALNLDLNILKNKFLNFKIPSGRGDVRVVNKFKKSFKLIDESYNANPLSMESAIQNISFYRREKNTQKIAFLGDMLELGKKSKSLHKELSLIINKSDIDKVFVYGKHIKETFNFLSENKKGKVFNSLNEAHNHFGKIIHNNDLLMIKGSNATGLNKFSKNIKKENTSVI